MAVPEDVGGGGGGGVGASRREYDIANRYLHELAERTGARNYEADSTQNLSSAFAQIAEELRRQYTLGYYPKTPAQAGQRRQIKVRVNQPNLAVRTRDSYVFNPAGPATDTARSAPVCRRSWWKQTNRATTFGCKRTERVFKSRSRNIFNRGVMRGP